MAQELSEQTRALVRSRIPDYETLEQQQQLRAAIKTIAEDFNIYRERNLMILHKQTGEIVPFELNWEQQELVKVVLMDIAMGRPVRYIILKARQMGISTVIEALCYWWTATHKNIKSVIIAHEADASGNLYEMFRRYFDYSHPTFQPKRKYNNKKEIVFDVDDTIKEQYKLEGKEPPGLRSSIKTQVAKEGGGRSATIHFFHGSEVAFWEAKADVVSSAIQAIPMTANTFGFLESTANGVGGFFYDEWQFAKKGESAFRPLFFPWHQHDEYELEAPEGGLEYYDAEETELLDIFKEKGYPKESWDRKIVWRREKKKEFRSDPKKFYQEYPKDDMEAFLASGRPVFDTKMLVEMENRAAKWAKTHTVMFGEVVPNTDPTSPDKFIFRQVAKTMETDPTPLKIFFLPEKGKRYVIGVDVSEGKLNTESAKKENDYSVIDVMDADELVTVARYRGHIDPDLLSDVVYALATFYNNALVGVEVNNHGLTTVQGLRNKFYRNLYMRENNEEYQFQERTAAMGWQTNRKTKPKIVNNLAAAIRDDDIIDLDIVFIRECMTYVRDDQGYTNAQEGMFDDTVIAKAICLEMANYHGISAEYAKENIQKPIKRNKNATTSTNTSLESIAAGKPAATSRHRDTISRRREAREKRRAARRVH